MNRYRKICVYAIAADEIKYVDQWFASMLEADYITCLVTRDNDGTLAKMKEYEEKYPGKVIIKYQEITPWRFDVARNESMKLIPDDAEILVCTDLDETLDPGWAEPLREAWTDTTQRCTYKYAWSETPDGKPLRIFTYNKIHDRHWSWKFSVHETLWDFEHDTASYSPSVSINLFDKIYLHHHPDRTKSRSTYLPLLELRKKEYPEDDMGEIYLANQYCYEGHYQKAIDEFDYILNKFNYTSLEQSACLRFKGDCFRYLGKPWEAIKCYNEAISKDRRYRKAYHELAKTYMDLKFFDIAKGVVEQGLKDGVRLFSWHETEYEFGYEPYDLLCLADYYSGHYTEALENAIKARDLDPDNERLQENVRLCYGAFAVCDKSNH